MFQPYLQEDFSVIILHLRWEQSISVSLYATSAAAGLLYFKIPPEL